MWTLASNEAIILRGCGAGGRPPRNPAGTGGAASRQLNVCGAVDDAIDVALLDLPDVAEFQRAVTLVAAHAAADAHGYGADGHLGAA